jgi:putative transcriptional regulator
MDQTPYLTGQTLLAMPGIGDPRFERAVIAMCQHDEKGAMGIGIGHVLATVSLHSLFDQFHIDCTIPDAQIHRGGPVEEQRGFVLHTPDWGGDGTVYVGDHWAFTSTIDILRAIAVGKGPRQWIVALGYAGWGPGQLDREMTQHGWHVTEAPDAAIFGRRASERWEACFQSAGIDPRLLVAETGQA